MEQLKLFPSFQLSSEVINEIKKHSFCNDQAFTVNIFIYAEEGID